MSDTPYTGNSRNMPESMKDEAVDMLGWLVMKHGPFTLPPRKKILEDLMAMHNEGKVIVKQVERDKEGKSIANHIFATDMNVKSSN